jgi:hypothetical protein
VTIQGKADSLEHSASRARAVAHTEGAAARLPTLLIALFVLLLTVIAVEGEFVALDDYFYTGGRTIPGELSLGGLTAALTDVSSLYWHPITWVSHSFDLELFGQDPRGHHLSSVVLHAGSSGLLFLLFLQLGIHGPERECEGVGISGGFPEGNEFGL